MGSYSGNKNLKLSGVDYLCLSIQSDPGRGKRYHLRKKNIYQHGSDYSNGANGMSGYFRPGCFYDYNLWYDDAPSEGCFWKKDWRGSSYLVPRQCQMKLTRKGWSRANKARQKIGLKPLPFKD